MAYWLRWHRCFGLIACLAIMLWSLSGILHTAMMRLQPHAATMMPPVQSVSLSKMLPLKTVLRKNHVDLFKNAHLVVLEGRLYYQVEQDGLSYFDVKTGQAYKNGSIHHAEFLARHYVNDLRSKIKNIQPLTHFDEDYAFINRLLPVYQVDFERPDGLRVYVELSGGRLGTITNNTKILMGRLFQFIHTWSFVNAYPYLKLLMLVFLFSGFLTGLSGVFLYFRLKTATDNRSLRNYHRQLGLVVSVAIMAWTSTGTFHLLKMYIPANVPMLPKVAVSTDSLPNNMSALHSGLQNFSLLQHQNRLLYRVERQAGQSVFHADDAEHGKSTHGQLPKEKLVYIDAESGQILQNQDINYAKSLARFYSGLPDSKIKSTTLVTSFNDEYGFIFKRLPVYRVAYDTPPQDTYFIETSTGSLASHMTNLDRVEGLLFAYLHKWALLGKNQDLRDGLVILFALINILVAMSGLFLWTKPLVLKGKR